MKSRTNAWVNAMFLAVTLVINVLGSFGVINGLSQREVSDMFPTLITPAPFAFGIWAVIYGLLIISAVVMIIKAEDKYYSQAIEKLSILFPLTCILNISWIIAFSCLLIELSSIFILCFTIVLLLICKELLAINQKDKFLLPLTFGLYAGWITIATMVNIAATLVKLKWDGFGIPPEVWAGIILVISILLVALVLFSNKNAAYPLPVAWAYFGIYQSLMSQNGYAGQYPTLQWISLIGMVVLIILAAVKFYLNNYFILPNIESENTKNKK